MIQQDSQVISHPEEFLDALSVISSDKRYDEIKEKVLERTRKEPVTMCVIADEFENRGVKRGIEKGLEKGIEVLVLDNLEDGKTKLQIVDKLVRRFSLSSEAAEAYFVRFAGKEESLMI